MRLRWLSRGSVVLAGLIFAPLPPTSIYPPPPIQPLPQIVQPVPNGYIVTNPGQLPTFIRQMPNGGFIIQPPIKFNSGAAADGDGS